jgi:hypothetical protein
MLTLLSRLLILDHIHADAVSLYTGNDFLNLSDYLDFHEIIPTLIADQCRHIDEHNNAPLTEIKWQIGFSWGHMSFTQWACHRRSVAGACAGLNGASTPWNLLMQADVIV